MLANYFVHGGYIRRDVQNIHYMYARHEWDMRACAEENGLIDDNY
jgi:hypothetical protein